MLTGEITVIGATTVDQHRKKLEADKTLGKSIETVLVEEPSSAEVLSILFY